MTGHRRVPRRGPQREGGFVPAASLQEAEARAMPAQPEALRRWQEQHREAPPPDWHDHVVDGKTSEVRVVEDAAKPLPAPRPHHQRRRPWCSVCARYMTQKEVKAGHKHDAAVPEAGTRKKKTTKKQSWRWQGLAGRVPLEEKPQRGGRG